MSIKLGQMKLNIGHTNDRTQKRDLDLAQVMRNVGDIIGNPTMSCELMKESMYGLLIRCGQLQKELDRLQTEEKGEQVDEPKEAKV